MPSPFPSVPLPGVSAKILVYLDQIDACKGKAKRMDFLRIAGNEIVLNAWVNYLVGCNLINVTHDGPKEYYSKTKIGFMLHDLLKLHSFVGPLFEDLSRQRRHTPQNFVISMGR